MLLAIFLSVLGLCACKSVYCVWFFMVLGSLGVTSWLKSHIFYSSTVLFFVVSVLGGLFFLLSRIDTHLQGVLLIVSLFLKIGVFPFHFWVLRVLCDLGTSALCFFLGPAKVGYLFLLVSSSPSHLGLPLLALSFGLHLSFCSSSLYLLLYASGSCQILFLCLLGGSFFYPFFFAYLLSLFAISSTSYSIISPIVAFLRLGGVPPLPFFWGKFSAITALPLVWSAVLLLSSGVILHPYMSFALSGSSSSHSSPSFTVSISCLAGLPLFL